MAGAVDWTPQGFENSAAIFEGQVEDECNRAVDDDGCFSLSDPVLQESLDILKA